MPKLDLKKNLKGLYTAPKKPEIIDVGPGKFLTHTGRGPPGGELYVAGLGALYGLSYTLKFMAKAKGQDYTVMPLEGLWWWDDSTIFEIKNAPPRDEWNFKSMMRQPEFITQDMVVAAKPKVKEKSGDVVDDVVLEHFHEGLSAQIMHIGPYSEEEATVKILHDFIHESGYKLRGRHHEVYLSDPNRTAPERIKTILRHPIEKQ